MIVIYPPKHYLHDPKFEIFGGEKVPSAECPKRVDVILKSLKENNFIVQPFTQKLPVQLLESIHSHDYLEYFKSMSSELKEKVKYPSVFFNTKRKELRMSLNNIGFYSIDTYTPLTGLTYQAAFDSASCAYEAAKKLKDNKDRLIYALCRPPGHHAESNRMGGYCYFNNTAIAVQYLSGFGKVVILDLDFHHGNGTQNIFYQRNDVFYISIHADPTEKYPHFSGYKDEIGEDKGKGFNINIPLPLSTNDDQYQKALEKSLEILNKFKPDYLVISFGGDTYQKDPIGGFGLTLDYYKKMAKTIKNKITVPIVVIQEGGYNIKDLGRLTVNFLNGLID